MDKQQIVDKRMKKAREARITKLANKGKDTYLNLRWMQRKYYIENKSLDDIAYLCKVEYDIIWEALKKLKIPNRIIATEDEIEKYKKEVLSILRSR